MLDSAKRLLAPSARSQVPPFMVMDVVAAAARLEAAGRRVIHMEIGQPAASAPATALAAARTALAAGKVEYTASLGLASVRRRIARHYAERHALDVDPGRIVVTTGSSAAFLLAFLAICNPGDRVAVANPGYPPCSNVLSALGCEAVPIEVDAATRFAIAPDALLSIHCARPLKAVLAASPANPTGTMMTAEALTALARAAEDAGIAFISDEIYHGLDYEFAAPTALGVSSDAIVINSFSKYFCMTGWRIGWMVVPEALVRTIERLQQNLAISVPALSQFAAEAAFAGAAEMEAVKRGYEDSRRLLAERLPAAGLSRFPPMDGAFYLYADVSHLCEDSFAFAARILEDTGVAMTPGVDFDRVNGHRFIRLCYAGAAEDVREAVERLESWLRRG